MASEEDDFFGEEDDDLDAETLQLLDQAEKQHAAAFSASQLPAATQKNAHRATTEPVKTLPQAHKQFAPNSALSTSNGRLPNASQQQRAVSARPAVQHVNRVQAGPASSQQRQQQQQYTASQQPNRTYNSNQYANAVAGPSTSNYVRRVVKPVYRDDFPNVDIDETGKQYRPRNVSAQPSAAAGANLGATSQPIFDTEKDELKRQLAELQASLEKERKERFAKDGEVSYLRQQTEKLAKEHEIAIQEQLRKVLPLQEKITNLESRLNQENARHSSALIFQKQELESKYRNVAASVRKRQQQQQQQQQQSQLSKTAASQSSPKRPFKTQKGFQNSFYEPMTSTQRGDNGAALPSSPSDGRMQAIQSAHSPNSRDKGKQREFDPSSEMDYNDIPDQQADPFDAAYDETREETSKDAVATHTSIKTLREEIISFLFDHTPHDTSQSKLSLYSLVNPDLPPDLSEDRIRVHRKICQKLFHCFGRRPETAQPDKKQIALFIWDIIEVLLNFVDFFSAEEKLRTELITALNLTQDLCQRYASIIPQDDTTAAENEDITGKIFSTITKCVHNERARAKSLDISPLQPSNAVAGRLQQAALGPRSKQARNEAAIARFEREVEPTLCAVLYLLQFLALRPDSTRLSHLDDFLRESNNLAFLLDARRLYAVHVQALTLTALLSGEQSLFRSLLSTPFQDQPGGNDARPAAATAANRTQMLPLVEHTAGFLTYRSADTAQSRICQQLALITLSNLTIIDPDGTPLLSRSPSLIPKLIIRLASDAAILYDGASSPSSGTHLENMIRTVSGSMRLLFHLLLSQDGLKSLSTHLSERPFARDYFISGVGRIACTEAPAWIDPTLALQLDLLANLGFELLEDVLSPDEVEDLYSLCRDEDEEEVEQDKLQIQTGNQRDDEEEMAAQNIDAMES